MRSSSKVVVLRMSSISGKTHPGMPSIHVLLLTT